MSRLDFRLEARASGSGARAATFKTVHGLVRTPTFMAVGTQATVKSQTVDSLRAAGCTVLLANTYHLLLRPGAEVFRKLGGIHRFMNWDGPVLTDSGGFQIFSLPRSRRLDEEGARFQSYVDGTSHLLSPESSIEMQRAIGSDIMMVLDECVPSTVDRERATAAMELTHRWAKRSLHARGDSSQALFAIVQGACFDDLRRRSAEVLTALPFDGFALGGLAVGETREKRDAIIAMSAPLLPSDLPRYLMGVGTPIDLLEAVHRGMDMFDCIIPSQMAHRGAAYTSQGRLQMRREIYRLSEDRLDPDCVCETCQRYSRAYLHHLYKCNETLGWTLLTAHNLTFYHRLMREIRARILDDSFASYYATKRIELDRTDNVSASAPPEKKSKRYRLGDYEIFDSGKGFSSVRQRSSGEVMHSVSEPSREAKLLYVEQSRLRERLSEGGERPLRIWDVGLGAATNAMAAIDCAESLRSESLTSRALHIVSFERDLDPLLLALRFPFKFSYLRHPAPHLLATKGRWSSVDQSLVWDRVDGDFAQRFETTEVPDLIFYDPFSLKTDSELWTPELFRRIRAHCGDLRTELYTYSASTSVRAALLWAGFFVGRGLGTGPKSETTIACTHLSSVKSPLGPEWLDRWSRSHAKFPVGVSTEQQKEFESRITGHPQFRIASMH